MQKQGQKQDEKSPLYSKYAPFYILTGAIPLLLLDVSIVLAATHVLGSQTLLLLFRLIVFVGLPYSLVACIVGMGPWTHNWITYSVQARWMSRISTFAPSLLTFGLGVILIWDGFSTTQFGPALMGLFETIIAGFGFYRACKKVPSGE